MDRFNSIIEQVGKNHKEMTNKTISCAMHSIDFSALFFDLVFFGSFLFLPEKRKKKKKSISRVLCNATFIVMFRSVGWSVYFYSGGIDVNSLQLHSSHIVIVCHATIQQYDFRFVDIFHSFVFV